MNYQHTIVQKDLLEIVDSAIDWDQFNNKSVLVTGINGMLATYLMFTFIW